ncbi:MAG: sugar ABC transporter ATP-binding protein [Clostridiales Family XIII bacterium]|jgi:ABC-type sugar transport system ATPase subunit|nr:sugar ABC transporter ATP-binding protein [Clostridiales Family XIII bacterium]
MTGTNSEIYIEARKVRKVFQNTVALDDVDFEVRKGEVHAIVGENGAGKSTLMKILSGVHQMTSGELVIGGERAAIASVADSQRYGISIIYQELSNFPKLSVTENIFMGRQIRSKAGVVNFAAMASAVREMLQEYEIDINPRARLDNLTVAEKQFVEIIKAVSVYGTKVVIMDEPTSSLTRIDIEKLYKIIENLKKHDVSVIFISHHLEEVFEIADRVTVFRDGRNVACIERKDFDEDELIALMLGHSIHKFEKRRIDRREVIFEIRNLSIKNRIEDFSIKLYKGEVLGIAGLTGSGKDELIKSLFNLWPARTKDLYLKGEQIAIRSPIDALEKGIVYLPEERKTQALFPEMPVYLNILAIWLFHCVKRAGADKRTELREAEALIEKLGVKTSSPRIPITSLSGGNQQKAIIARLLAVGPEIMILNDPTRGIDVGSKDEIYRLIRQLAENGTSIVLVSSEMEEICYIADRAVVLSKGVVRGEFSDEDVNMGNILPCAIRSDKRGVGA